MYITLQPISYKLLLFFSTVTYNSQSLRVNLLCMDFIRSENRLNISVTITGDCFGLLASEKYTLKDHISNTKLEKGDHYYIQTCPEKLSKIQTKCAHAPWASYNTP